MTESCATEFWLQQHIEQLLTDDSRREGWRGGDASTFRDWQAAARTRLRELLRLPSPPRATPSARLLGHQNRSGYVEEHWAVVGHDDVAINCYLLVPESPGPHVPVLVLHGHNPSVQYCMGHYPDAATSTRMLARQGNYAQALAQAGYLVCAVEQRGFGERRSAGVGQEPEQSYTCRHLFLAYLLLDRNLQGERVADARFVVDWLLTRPGLRVEALTVTGQSGGGTTALYLGAMDERIQVCIPACGFGGIRSSLLAEGFAHCLCNYVPGLLRHFDAGDIAACVAPRALRTIHGAQDPIFPLQGVKEQHSIITNAYMTAGVPDRFSTFIHPDGHRYDLDATIGWIYKNTWGRAP